MTKTEFIIAANNKEIDRLKARRAALEAEMDRIVINGGRLLYTDPAYAEARSLNNRIRNLKLYVAQVARG